jgi:hypothetical protein
MKNLNKTAALATMALAAAMASAQIGVTVDGQQVHFDSASPRYMNGRVLVPLRGVFEHMGANVDWDAANRTVIANGNGKDIKLRIGAHNAWVDGVRTPLDVPAQIIAGTTMVPIRFLSESLGAAVRWDDRDQLVLIDTGGTGAAQTYRQTRPMRVNRYRTFTIPSNTVIPFTLNTDLSSAEARKGDQFSATIQTDNGDSYENLPAGTLIDGHVIAARRQRGDKPGLLEVGFDRLKMPDGRTVNIDGSLISLDAKNIDRTNNGRIVAKGGSNKDNRTVWAGYGAGAGLIVGILGKRPLENAVIGGLLGYLAGSVQQNQNRPQNVHLSPGTEFGVRLNQDLAIRLPRDEGGK